MPKRPTLQTHRKISGFTMVEIIVVIVLMSICLYPLGRMLARALMESTEDHHLAVCAFLAQDKIEWVRSQAECFTGYWDGGDWKNSLTCPTTLDPDGWGNTKEYNVNIAGGDPKCNLPAPFDKYSCTIEYLDTLGDGNFVREIQVRVCYDDNDDDTCDATEKTNVTLETLLSQRSPI